MITKLIKIIQEAGELMLHADITGARTASKTGHANFVTEYDRKVQEFLKERLLALLPGAAFVGEEEEDHAFTDQGDCFIVDPIDGTTNFMKSYRSSAISIALLRDGKPFLGVTYNPYLKEIYSAERGKGAFCNGKPIHVSKRPLEDGLVIVGTAPYYRDELADRTFSLMRYYFDRCLDIRRSGSSVLDLCNVACGRAELFFELRLSPWDYAAGALIVEEAGGRVTTVEGEPLRYDRPVSVLASGCGEG